MPIIIAVILLILLSIKFIGRRAYLYANVVVFTICWTTVLLIMSKSVNQNLGLMLILEVVSLGAIVLILYLSSIKVPKGKKMIYCKDFTRYGFWILLKVFLICSIILYPIFRFITKEDYMETRITDLGQRVRVCRVKKGIYEDSFGNRYKEKEF